MSGGEHVDLQRRAQPVVLLELIGLHAVGRGALGPPGRSLPRSANPDRTASGLTVLTRIAGAAALLGEASREVEFGRLGGRVGRCVPAGDDRVLGGDKDDRSAGRLRPGGCGTLRARSGSSRSRESGGCAPTHRARSPRSASSTRSPRWRRRCRRRRTAPRPLRTPRSPRPRSSRRRRRRGRGHRDPRERRGRPPSRDRVRRRTRPHRRVDQRSPCRYRRRRP